MSTLLESLRRRPTNTRGRVVEATVIALGYAGACLLVASASLPMVFTSVIWLPAGLAFGAVYIRGYGVAPSLFVGGILSLVTRAIELDGSTPRGVTASEVTIAILLEATIVVGHAVLGVWLIRRFVPDRDLATLRGAGAFLLLAGPVSCLVGSVLGPPAMLLRSIVETDGLLTVAFGFLGGDSMGVLVLAPVIAAIAGSGDAWRGRLMPIALVMSAMLAALLALHGLVFRSEGDRVARVFQAQSERDIERINASLAESEQPLLRLDNLLAREASREAPRGQYDDLIGDVAQQVPAVASVQALRVDNGWQLVHSTSTTATFDADAAMRAIERGETVARDVSDDAQRSIALYRPVYDVQPAPADTRSRRRAAVGAMVLELRLDHLLRDATAEGAFNDAGIAFGTLGPAGGEPDRWHGINDAANRFIVDGQVRPQDILREHRSQTVERFELAFGDRVLPIAVAPGVSFLRNESFLLAAMPLSIASMLLAFSVGVSSLVLTGRNARLAQLVAERTEALTRNERRYRTVVDSVAEVIFRAERDGALQFVNHSWFEVMSPDDPFAAEGRTIGSFVAEADRAQLAAAMERVPAEPGRIEATEVRLARDQSRWIEIRMRHDPDEDAIFGTIVDTTSRHAVEVEREHFVSMVSHEFRTPVTVISGAIDTIERTEHDSLPPLAARLMPAMRSSSRRLLRLVEDLLLAARLDAGTMRFERRAFDVVDVVRSCVEVGAVDATAAGLELRSTLPSRRVTIEGDPDRIGQLVDNLLSNAIKYSASGTTVELALRSEGPGVELDVVDQGIGISPADQQHLFDRFWRAGEGARAASGTGLGLAICRQIAEAHGGTITVDSELGSGSTFRVRLPRTTAVESDGMNTVRAPTRR